MSISGTWQVNVHRFHMAELCCFTWGWLVRRSMAWHQVAMWVGMSTSSTWQVGAGRDAGSHVASACIMAWHVVWVGMA